MGKIDMGTMGREARRLLRDDNNINILVVGANSQTGIGKTTFAIQLCRYIEGESWCAEDRAFIDIQQYLQTYLEVPGGSALLLDEIEHGADSRRANSTENVNLSQGWAKLRSRNIATVATLPSVSMLDKRMLELADYWVLVKRRGVAQPYRINVNDFAPNKLPQRQPLPGDEHIRFRDLPDGDSDKEYLDQIKDDIIRDGGTGMVSVKKHKKEVEKARKNAAKPVRNEAIYWIYENTDLSTTDIHKLDWVDVSQSQVSVIVRDMKAQKEADSEDSDG